jgi:type VI secretion system protein ImpK
MKLIQAFISTFEYLEKIQVDLTESSSLSLEQVRDKFQELVNAHRRDCVESGYQAKHFDLAMFAVCALIDEKTLDSEWVHRDEWLKQPLQKEFFDTNNAGQLFFERLDALNEFNQDEQDIREVYLYCLKQGFVGCYFQAGDQSRLQEIIQANYLLLTEKQSTQLFSPTVPQLEAEPLANIAMQKFKDFCMLWGPLVFVISCYFWLRFDLFEQISLFIKDI